MTSKQAYEARSKELHKAAMKYDKATAKFRAKFQMIDEWHTGIMCKHEKAYSARNRNPKAFKVFKKAEETLRQAWDKWYKASSIRDAKCEPFGKIWDRERQKIYKKYQKFIRD